MPGNRLLAMVCMASVVFAIIAVYVLLLRRALISCRPANRQMEPAQVFLLFVPLINIIWNFVIMHRIPGTLRAESVELGIDDGGDYGMGAGLLSCWAYLAFNVVGFFDQTGDGIGWRTFQGLLLIVATGAWFWFIIVIYKATSRINQATGARLAR